MRIAQVAPLFESVPPSGYGGTERIVSYLTEELVRQGHDVTLFATADSITSAELVPSCARPLRADPSCRDTTAVHLYMLEEVARQAHAFDLVHFHTGYFHFPLVRRLRFPHVTTLHGRLDYPEFVALHEEYSELPVVSISASQRTPLSGVNWSGTVYHGLPPDLYRMGAGKGDYFAFVGRISPEKGLHDAVEIARRMQTPLKVAAKVEMADIAYFEAVKHVFDDPLIDWVGEINDDEKQEFLGNARALLFPINWPEPFGLVMIEAMACGTPTVAFRHGSVPEVIDDGVSGFIVDDVAGAVRALDGLDAFDRAACRATFERRFTAGRMAADYLRIYGDLASLGQAMPELSQAVAG
jgi:glycosyltransferase involved in cell wall biosynthesis